MSEPKPRMSHELRAIQHEMGDWLYSPDLKWSRATVTRDGKKEIYYACTIPDDIYARGERLIEFMQHHGISGAFGAELKNSEGVPHKGLLVPEDKFHLIKLQAQYNTGDRNFQYNKAKDWDPSASRGR